MTGTGDEAIHLRTAQHRQRRHRATPSATPATASRQVRRGRLHRLGGQQLVHLHRLRGRPQRPQRRRRQHHQRRPPPRPSTSRRAPPAALVARQHLRRLRHDRRRLLGRRQGQQLADRGQRRGPPRRRTGSRPTRSSTAGVTSTSSPPTTPTSAGRGSASRPGPRSPTSSSATTPSNGAAEGLSNIPCTCLTTTTRRGECSMKTCHVTTSPRITVLGTGYLGATHAICMAVLGYEVLGVDTDRAKIEALARGEVPFFEPGLPEMLRKALDSGRLPFTTDLRRGRRLRRRPLRLRRHPAAQGLAGRRPELRRAAVVRDLAPHLRRTLPGRRQVHRAGRHGRAAHRGCSRTSPRPARRSSWPGTRSSSGRGTPSRTRCTRTGSSSGWPPRWAEDRLREAFAPLLAAGTPSVVTDLATAELVKVAANSFLATKISFINAMAEVCEATGADVQDLAACAGLRQPHRRAVPQARPRLRRRLPAQGHPRLRPPCRGARRRPGPWPSCVEVDAINNRRRARTVDLVREQAGGSLAGARVCCLGAALQAELRRHPRRPRPRRGPDAPGGGRRSSRSTTREAMDNARRAYPDLELRRRRDGGGSRVAGRGTPDRVGPVPLRSTRHGSPR